MIYSFFRGIFKLALWQFFSNVRAKGAAPIENGALLVVPNHANFLIDSLLIASLYKRDFYFMAKSTLFKGALLSKFLRMLHLVPIYRRQDNQDTSKNEESFRFATQSLRAERALVLFPEGVSLGERKLQPIKSGAARIALQAEADSAWKLDLSIQPVGITYSDIDQFRSSVTVFFGEALKVAGWREKYEADAVLAARELTVQIEERLKSLTVEVSDLHYADFVEKLGKLYQSNSMLDDHERLKLIASNVEKLAPNMPGKREELELRLDEYLGMLQSLGFDKDSAWQDNYERIELLVSLPLAIIGFISHYLPYRMVGPIAHRFSTHPVSLGSLKLVVGLFVFTFWYLALFALCLCSGFTYIWSALFLLFIIFCGSYLNRNIDGLRLLVLSRLWPGEYSPLSVLKVMRGELIEELESLRVE